MSIAWKREVFKKMGEAIVHIHVHFMTTNEILHLDFDKFVNHCLHLDLISVSTNTTKKKSLTRLNIHNVFQNHTGQHKCSQYNVTRQIQLTKEQDITETSETSTPFTCNQSMCYFTWA